jgi:hypothetical protein
MRPVQALACSSTGRQSEPYGWYGRPVSRPDQQSVGVAVSRFAAAGIVVGGGRLIRSAMGVDAVLLAALLASGCGEPGTTSKTGWEGQIDSLPNGQVVVHNGDRGVWPEGAAWRLVADARVGSVDSPGPQSFAFIVSFAVDAEDRVWVLDGQASELRVFDRHGAHVRTIGRLGKGRSRRRSSGTACCSASRAMSSTCNTS